MKLQPRIITLQLRLFKYGCISKLGNMLIFASFKIVIASVGALSNQHNSNLNTDTSEIRPEAQIRLILLSRPQRKQTGCFVTFNKGNMSFFQLAKL